MAGQQSTAAVVPKKKSKMRKFWIEFRKQTGLQIMVLIGFAFLAVFHFAPMYGLQLAFKEMIPGMSIGNAKWVGLKHFQDFFSREALVVIGNTITLSLMKIIVGFPVPIIFALLMNEIRSQRIRSVIQGISYMPHFLSWVVIFGIVSPIFALNNGVLNDLFMSIGLIDEPIHWLGRSDFFYPLLTFLDIWKEMGWSAIIYMAAISGIDQQLYEAASVDGAGRLRQVISITIPAIMPTVAIMLIQRSGSILSAGFDPVLVFRNSMTHEVSKVIDVYVMDQGVNTGRFGYATAVGVFKSVVSVIMVTSTNAFARKFEMSMW